MVESFEERTLPGGLLHPLPRPFASALTSPLASTLDMQLVSDLMSEAGPREKRSAPVITLQPVSQAVGAGARVTFTAAATGAMRVQWQVKRVGGTFTNIAGANSPTFSFVARLRN